MTTSRKRTWILVGTLLVLALLLAACKAAENPAPTPIPPTPVVQVQPTTAPPEPTAAPEGNAAIEVPFVDKWQASGHNTADAPAFTHWNEEDPKEIPTTCAKCHSTPGFQDYMGADGSAFGAVDKAAATGTTITCVACHNDATFDLSTVMFPSGVELTGLGNEALCMTCHQGTASKVQVDEAITAAGATDDDTVVADLGFTNLHYFAAAVTRYGKVVHGGYEYDGKGYDALFDHVKGVDQCTDCHNPHSLELKVEVCAGCHPGVAAAEDAKNIRMFSSTVDYDGDGDVTEGVFYEIEGVRALLYQAMQAYATNVSKTPIVYSAAAYPYFFIDTNNDGETGDDEATFANRFNAWTPRLAKAAYNYQTSIKDPGQFAHGGKYIIELLYDSTASLNEKLSTPVDLTAAHRTDAGHFDGSAEAWRHWDEEGEVSNACARCHSGEGLPTFLANGVNVNAATSNGLLCETCHSNLQDYARYEVESIKFPSGATATFEGLDSNLCMECHQGRQSTVTVDAAIKGKAPDKVDESIRFLNVHYFAAGATLFGNDAKGAYQFPNKSYLGRFMHVPGFTECINCHDAHALQPKVEACAGCHNTDDPTTIRGASSTVDYDGDGDVTEGIAGEIATMQETLLAALQKYSAGKLGAQVGYSPSANPYFFIDTNTNGVVDPEEANSDNRYATWSPKLLQSAYNYQYVQKDPGAFAHNGKYILQVLYDSIQNVGGSVSGMKRP